MNKDFRVLVTLPVHPKTKKLMRQLGDRSFYNLIRLWAWVAQNKPEGVLANMDKDDIEIAADWEGDEGLFVDTLIALRLVDCNEGVCEIHDWEINNGFAFGAAQRSEKARNAAKARWGSKDANHAKSCLEQCSEDAQAKTSNAPSPSPSPSLNNIPYKKIIEHLNEKTGKNFRSSTKETQRSIRARFNEGFTFDDFLTVINNKSEKWRNDQNMVDYLRPQTLFGTKFEAYLNECGVKKMEAKWIKIQTS
jgi:uncharacterized phage protein (TIGR02220 family)